MNDFGTNETKRVENVNRYFKSLLKSPVLTISELMIRFVQFEQYYNKNDNFYEEELKKLKEIEVNYNNIPMIKNFATTFTEYAKFINSYWQSLFLRFPQQSKKAKHYEVGQMEMLAEKLML